VQIITKQRINQLASVIVKIRRVHFYGSQCTLCAVAARRWNRIKCTIAKRLFSNQLCKVWINNL